jgi:hypothetical protein
MTAALATARSRPYRNPCPHHPHHHLQPSNPHSFHCHVLLHLSYLFLCAGPEDGGLEKGGD